MIRLSFFLLILVQCPICLWDYKNAEVWWDAHTGNEVIVYDSKGGYCWETTPVVFMPGANWSQMKKETCPQCQRRISVIYVVSPMGYDYLIVPPKIVRAVLPERSI